MNFLFCCRFDRTQQGSKIHVRSIICILYCRYLYPWWRYSQWGGSTGSCLCSSKICLFVIIVDWLVRLDPWGIPTTRHIFCHCAAIGREDKDWSGIGLESDRNKYYSIRTIVFLVFAVPKPALRICQSLSFFALLFVFFFFPRTTEPPSTQNNAPRENVWKLPPETSKPGTRGNRSPNRRVTN